MFALDLLERAVTGTALRGSGLGKGVARTHALEALIIVGFLRGLSVCDVEALLEEALGEQVVGKSTVARICQDTRERYRAWGERALWAHDLVCCYLDAIYLKLRPDDEPVEGVLIAWGLTLEGQKVLLALQLGSRESYESWLDFGRDLTERGMRAPALVIADEAAEIWKATRALLPDAISHVQSIIIVWRDPRQRTGREDRPLKVLRDLGQPLDSARANEETHLVPRQPGGGTGRSAPRVASPAIGHQPRVSDLHSEKEHMSTEDSSRRIVLSNFAPGGPDSETAISLLDEAGQMLHTAPVDADGSCVLAEEALAAAKQVLLGPINVGVQASQFRALLETEPTLDVAALLAGPAPGGPQRRGMAAGLPAIPGGHPHHRQQ